MEHCGLHCLKIEHIGVTLGGETLLRDVSLHAHCGELTALIGRNGAGKSTLLKAILGELPHTGKVDFSGHDGAPAAGKPRIGYVPQSLNLDRGSPATVYDLALAFTSAYPAFLPKSRRIERKFAEHFARFRADYLLGRPAGRLSGGELQRVLLAVAPLPMPDLLVLDEPVSGVDRAGLRDFYSLLEDLKQTADMVILLVSHDLDFVRRAADRVVLLDAFDGVLPAKPEICCRTPEDTRQYEEDRRLFYVAMTRARHKLVLFDCKTMPSVFVQEVIFNLPESRAERELAKAETNRVLGRNTPAAAGPALPPVDVAAVTRVGAAVQHAVFGRGVVTEFDGRFVTVEFSGMRVKKLDAALVAEKHLLWDL